jgi:sugar phosphate isomerase/epimerase
MTMKFAIQEDMLPGRTLKARLSNARALGFDGVEFWSETLTARVPEVAEALAENGLTASAVNMGHIDGFLYPEAKVRDGAVSAMRQALADASDIGAVGVTFVPHYGANRQPDLTPFKTPIEIEYELMVWLLRGVSDLAYAIGVELYMQPVNRYETHFMTRLEQAVHFRRQIKDHPFVKVAANLFHMALEETQPLESLRTALQSEAKDVGVIYLADSNRRLPGQGLLDFAAVMREIKNSGYDGWLTLECGTPRQNAEFAHDIADALPPCLTLLRSGD